MKINYFVIPYHFKDIKTLALSCENINNIFKPKKIYLIGSQPFSTSSSNIEIIKETDVKEIMSINEICKIWQKNNPELRQRGGWLYQQLIKILAYRICRDIGDTYMISDADIIWISDPYKNVPDDCQPLSKSFVKDCWLSDSIDQYERIMGEKAIIKNSFINHHMIIKKRVIEELVEHVEKRHGCRYDEALMKNYDFKSGFGFSEYETYANYHIKTRTSYFDVHLKVKNLKGIPSTKEVERYTKEGYWHFLDCQYYNRK